MSETDEVARSIIEWHNEHGIPLANRTFEDVLRLVISFMPDESYQVLHNLTESIILQLQRQKVSHFAREELPAVYGSW